MSLLEGIVGKLLKKAVGSQVSARMDPSGALVTTHGHARYQEPAINGNVYSAIQAATGVSIASLTVGTTGQFTLYNPKNSGIKAVLIDGFMHYVSGTFGGGSLVWVANTNPAAAAVTGTAIVTVNASLGSPTGIIQAFTTSTLPATPTLLRSFCSVAASLATTAVPPFQIIDNLDGKLVIEPGCALSIEGTTAAGTSPVVVFGATWEEVPI